MGIPKIIVTDRVRLPKKLIPKEDIVDRYVIELFDDVKCGPCSNRPDRGPDNELCIECPAFQGVHRFYNSKEAKEGIWSLPQADLHGIKSYLRGEGKEFKVIDKRPIHEVKTPFKFNGKLYRKGQVDDEGNPRPDQVKAVKRWMKKKNGVIQAPARSGKTVIATYCYTALQVKTVIIANQKELLNQFYETAVGEPAPRFVRGKFQPSDKKAGRFPVTNLKKVQTRTGEQVIFMPSSFSNLEQYIAKHGFPDVLLVTYQSFIKDIKRVAQIINKNYSLAIVDEQHGAGADAYLRFVASLNLKYRLGLTATPDRKDSRSKLAARVFGPVVAKIDTVTLKPTIEFYPVKAEPKSKHTTWYGAAKWAKTNKERNVEIVKMAFNDLRNGHNVIIIPVEHKDHMDHLVEMINHQARINFKKKKENWPADLARAFHGGVKDRLEVLNWVDDISDTSKIHKKLPTQSPRVLVAIRGIIKQGVDMKRPSMLYSILPMSAKYKVGAPMFYQMSFRVCTPFKKAPPVVRIFVDNIPMFARCATSILFNEVYPNSTRKDPKNGRYVLADYEQAKNLVAARTSGKTKERQSGKWW